MQVAIDNKLSNRVWFDLLFPIEEEYKPAVGEAPKTGIKQIQQS